MLEFYNIRQPRLRIYENLMQYVKGKMENKEIFRKGLTEKIHKHKQLRANSAAPLHGGGSDVKQVAYVQTAESVSPDDVRLQEPKMCLCCPPEVVSSDFCQSNCMWCPGMPSPPEPPPTECEYFVSTDISENADGEG